MTKWGLWWTLLAPLALSGCEQGDPSPMAYSHWDDRLAASFGLAHIIGVCSHRIRINDSEGYVSNATDQCYRMQPTKIMRGIWLDEFEGSRFYENATTVDQGFDRIRQEMVSRKWPNGTWLGAGKAALPAGEHSPRLVLIEFVGRKTAYDGRYGHMGMSQSEVLIDKLLSAKVLYVSKGSYLEDELKP